MCCFERSFYLFGSLWVFPLLPCIAQQYRGETEERQRRREGLKKKHIGFFCRTNPLPRWALPLYRCAAQGERFKSVASNILNSSIAVPRSIAGCCTQQNIGEMARSDGGVENSLSSADLYWTFTPFSFPLKEHFRLKILRPMGENEKGKHRGENKKAPATKRPQLLIHNKIQMITYSKPELHQQHKPRCNPP